MSTGTITRNTLFFLCIGNQSDLFVCKYFANKLSLNLLTLTRSILISSIYPLHENVQFTYKSPKLTCLKIYRLTSHPSSPKVVGHVPSKFTIHRHPIMLYAFLFKTIITEMPGIPNLSIISFANGYMLCHWQVIGTPQVPINFRITQITHSSPDINFGSYITT